MEIQEYWKRKHDRAIRVRDRLRQNLAEEPMTTTEFLSRMLAGLMDFALYYMDEEIIAIEETVEDLKANLKFEKEMLGKNE